MRSNKFDTGFSGYLPLEELLQMKGCNLAELLLFQKDQSFAIEYTVSMQTLLASKELEDNLRSVFNKAITKAIREGLLKEENEHMVADQLHKIVRLPECPPVVIRTKGDRAIEEIPPREIAALMREIIKLSPELYHDDVDGLFRAILDHYGLVRMTTNTRGVLQKTHSSINNLKL